MSDEVTVKFYFGVKEEDAVKRFMSEKDDKIREAIFNNILRAPLTKMIESIIRTYKLYRPDISFNRLLEDTFSFLITKVHNFDPNKGTKAYSYIGTVCKNYLLAQLIKYNKEKSQILPYDDYVPELMNNPTYIYDPLKETINYDKLIDTVRHQINEMICNNNVSENEAKVGDSLLYIFENWELIFQYSKNKKFNKNLILFIVRERTHLTTKEVRQSMKKYKNIYTGLKKTLIESDE
jgi:dsDNA-binding SOS-regulon protein